MEGSVDIEGTCKPKDKAVEGKVELKMGGLNLGPLKGFGEVSTQHIHIYKAPSCIFVFLQNKQ